MPKLPQENILTRKISLDQIVETGNVRLNYNQEEIENLADSIFRYGLINPISVKFLREDENGIKKYELIAGHRRVRAYKHLCEKGHDYTQITATICHGEKEIVQLVENIQREQLSQIDIETAVKALVTAGMSQKEIAEELSKPLSWLHDTLAGSQVRENVEAQGVDTTGMSTKALSQLASIPGDKLPEAVTKAKENGGTVKAATKQLQEYRKENGIEAPKNAKKKNTETSPFDFEPEPITITVENVISEIRDYMQRQKSISGPDMELRYGFNNFACWEKIINAITEDLTALFEAYQHN